MSIFFKHKLEQKMDVIKVTLRIVFLERNFVNQFIWKTSTGHKHTHAHTRPTPASATCAMKAPCPPCHTHTHARTHTPRHL